MAAKLAKQQAAMDSLSWRISYAWNRAKDQQKTIEEMQREWQDLKQSADYQCLAEMRKFAIWHLWDHTRKITLAQNQIYGWFCEGVFYSSWSNLPEKYRHDDNLLKTLPSGHFWGDGAGSVTKTRYFLHSESSGEDSSHFLAAEPSLAIVN